MTIKLGINGMGRIGRCTLGAWLQTSRSDVQITHLNAPGPIETLAHLLRYDSIHGHASQPIHTDKNTLICGDKTIQVQSTYDTDSLDWTGVDIVLECSGAHNDRTACLKHIKQGAKRVLVSAPCKQADNTIVYGVNHDTLKPEHHVISNASCTTNCLAPLAKALHEAVGIEKGMMTTIHAYTGDQSIIDKRHDDLYRARAAAMSMIPTTTGAAKAIGLIIPALTGRLDGAAIRVPTPNVSCIDLTFRATKDTSVDEVNDCVYRAASSAGLAGILGFDAAPKVSIDFNHDSHSAVFAPDQTRVIADNLVRVMAWYDNEWGFSHRMLDVAVAMGLVIKW